MILKLLMTLTFLVLASCVQEIPVEELESETFVEMDNNSSVQSPQPTPPPVVEDKIAPKILSAIPSGMQPSSTTSVVLQVVTDESSECRYDLEDKNYQQMLNNLPSPDSGITHLRSFSVIDGTSYQFYVRCKDRSDNIQNSSHIISFAIEKKGVVDNTAPIITSVLPSGELASGTKMVNLTLASSEASVCKYSSLSSDLYDQMLSLDSTNGMNHSKTISGLVDGQSYSYYFLCKDIAGNLSLKSQISFSVKKEVVPMPIDLNLQARAILNRDCLSCHGGAVGTFKELDITKDEILFDKVKRFIVKGVPEESKIYQSLTASQGVQQMPPGRTIASSDQEIIRKWILAMPKDQAPPEEVVCDADADIKSSLTRRLTQKELTVSINDLLGVNIDLSGIRADQRNFYGITRDGSRLGIDQIEVQEYISAVEKMVDQFINNKSHSLFNCESLSGSALNTCLDNEFFPILYRSWRRPVLASLKTQFQSYFINKGFNEGLKYALNVVFLSPNFFFLSYDDNNENRNLNSFEIAERLSLLMWTRVPSVELLEIARTQDLTDKTILLREFRKLLDLDANQSNAQNRNLDRDKGWNFFLELQNQWLKLDEIANLQYEKPGVGEHLRWATMFFVEEMFRENKSVKEMMSADFTVVSSLTADLYGATFNDASENNYDVYNSPNRFRKLSLANTDRRGLLNQVGVLAINSGSRLGSEVNPTYRGLWHAQNILCDLPGALPSEVVLSEELKEENLSLKEKFKVHTSDPNCASCHQVMDPIGFGLWEYGELGQIRTQDKSGFPIVPDGELYNQFFTTSNQLIDIIAENQKTEACFMTHLATYSVGREINSEKSCTSQKILKEVKAKNGGILDMLEGIITSDLFIKRQKK